MCASGRAGRAAGRRAGRVAGVVRMAANGIFHLPLGEVGDRAPPQFEARPLLAVVPGSGLNGFGFGGFYDCAPRDRVKNSRQRRPGKRVRVIAGPLATTALAVSNLADPRIAGDRRIAGRVARRTRHAGIVARVPASRAAGFGAGRLAGLGMATRGILHLLLREAGDRTPSQFKSRLPLGAILRGRLNGLGFRDPQDR